MSGDEPDGTDPADEHGAKRPATGTADDSLADERSQTHGSPYDLRLAWEETRSHVLAATALFAVGLLGGLAMAAAGIDLLALLGLENVDELLPEDAVLTVEFIFLNNSRVYFIMLLGVITLGLATVVALAFNGIVIGWVVGLVAGEVGVGPVLALLAPHGIFELPAFWLAGGIALRLVHLLANYIRGERETVITRAGLGRAFLLVVLGWVLIAISAVVEVHVTPAIADAIYDLPGGSPVE